MNRKTITRMQRLLPLWALLLVSHAAHAVSLVALSPGVWVDEAQQRIYLSDPSGQPEARSLEDARLLWRAEQPAKLLLALDHYWLALGQSGSSGRGKLLLIDSNTGSLHDELLIDLPAQVSASVLPEPLRQFDAVAREHPQGAQLHWRYLAQPLRGALLQADGSAVAGDGVKAEGVVDIVLRDDRLQATARPDLSADLGAPDPLVPEAQRLPTLGSHTRQFRSANADHTMSSGLAADTSQGAALAVATGQHQRHVHDPMPSNCPLPTHRFSCCRRGFCIKHHRWAWQPLPAVGKPPGCAWSCKTWAMAKWSGASRRSTRFFVGALPP
jgi:hypothetical protein